MTETRQTLSGSSLSELRNKATELFNKKDWQAAIKCYDQLIAHSQDARDLGNRGSCFSQLGNWDCAIADYEKDLLTLVVHKNIQFVERLLAFSYLNKSVDIADPAEKFNLRLKAKEHLHTDEQSYVAILDYLDIYFSAPSESRVFQSIQEIVLDATSRLTPRNPWQQTGYIALCALARSRTDLAATKDNILLLLRQDYLPQVYYCLWKNVIKVMTDWNSPINLVSLDEADRVKDNLKNLILNLPNAPLRQLALLQSLSKKTFLGQIFYFQRMGSVASVGSGILKPSRLKLIAQALLREKNLVIDDKTRALLTNDENLGKDLAKHCSALHQIIFSQNKESKDEQKSVSSTALVAASIPLSLTLASMPKLEKKETTYGVYVPSKIVPLAQQDDSWLAHDDGGSPRPRS